MIENAPQKSDSLDELPLYSECSQSNGQGAQSIYMRVLGNPEQRPLMLERHSSTEVGKTLISHCI